MEGEGKSDRKYKRMSGIKLQNALAYLEHHRSAGEKPLCSPSPLAEVGFGGDYY